MNRASKPNIPWRDLVALTPGQVVFNVGLSTPFLASSWWAAAHGWYVLALPLSFFFFTYALRQAHDCYHRSIGLSARALHAMMYLLSATMLCSAHAIRYTHLQHHRDPLGQSDVEGNWARLKAWQALAWGPLFSVKIQGFGLLHGDAATRWHARNDMLVMLAVAAASAAWRPQWLVYHVVTMILANSLVGFFAVWSVHHDCEGEAFARTERQAWANGATVHLLYHIEHHLYAQVPANHLPELARRLDAAAPEWTQKRVLPTFRLPESRLKLGSAAFASKK